MIAPTGRADHASIGVILLGTAATTTTLSAALTSTKTTVRELELSSLQLGPGFLLFRGQDFGHPLVEGFATSGHFITQFGTLFLGHIAEVATATTAKTLALTLRQRLDLGLLLVG